MPDPKLKIAAEEIRAILLAHDIAGSISLASPTHGEYFMHVTPTWSCATIISGGGQETTPARSGAKPGFFRVKASVAQHGTKEARNKALEDTVHMISCFSATSIDLLHNCKAVLDMLQKHGLEITGEPKREED